jgi:hypothetical protein
LSSLLKKESFEKKIAKRKLAQQRQMARQLEKKKERLNDKVYIEAQKAKQFAAKKRQVDRQQEKLKQKLQDPDYLKQQQIKRKKSLDKKKDSAEKPQLKVVSIKKSAKPMSSKGLKGRSRTAVEKRLEKKLADIGCICCLNKGWYSSAMRETEGQRFISMHHVEGRTKPWAHAKQLPLCQYHHQVTPPADAPADLFPLHGSSLSAWEKTNRSQDDLLKQVYEMIGEERPWIDEESRLLYG